MTGLPPSPPLTDPESLSQLKALCAASRLGAAATDDAISDLAQNGSVANKASAQHLLDLLGRTLPNNAAALQARQRCGADHLEKVLRRAHAVAPDVLDLPAMLNAPQVVEQVTVPLLTDEELQSMLLGGNLSGVELRRFRQGLLVHGGILDQLSPAAHGLLVRAQKATDAVTSPVWRNPNCWAGVNSADQMVAAEQNLDVRLGVVLLGEQRSLTVEEFLDWMACTRSDLFPNLLQLAQVLLSRREEGQHIRACILVRLVAAVYEEGARRVALEIARHPNICWQVADAFLEEALEEALA